MWEDLAHYGRDHPWAGLVVLDALRKQSEQASKQHVSAASAPAPAFSCRPEFLSWPLPVTALEVLKQNKPFAPGVAFCWDQSNVEVFGGGQSLRLLKPISLSSV